MAEQTGKRHKCLTKDTAKALAATCRGFVDIAKQLLTTTHEYVLFGLFTTDPLEKMFGKLTIFKELVEHISSMFAKC